MHGADTFMSVSVPRHVPGWSLWRAPATCARLRRCSTSPPLPSPLRQVRELELLTRMAGLSTAGLYGEMKLGVDLEHQDAYRMVAVYKKPEA